MSFLPLYVYFIFISFLASLSVYSSSNISYPYLKLFPPFLLTTIIVESIGSYIGSIRISNLTLYNFFTVIEFCFYLYVIRMIISSTRVKKVFIIAIIAYGSIAIINIIFIQKLKAFHTMSYALGCLVIVAACVYYFFELFKLPKAVKLVNNPAFWICTGLLFFYCCGFPLYGMFNFLSGISRLIIRNFYSIIVILNIFLYSLFTIGFLCRLRVRKYIL
jgi:hypothetical protein